MSAVKVSCGCYAEWTGREWVVSAQSFLCDHSQGDHIDRAAPPEAVAQAAEAHRLRALLDSAPRSWRDDADLFVKYTAWLESL